MSVNYVGIGASGFDAKKLAYNSTARPGVPARPVTQIAYDSVINKKAAHSRRLRKALKSKDVERAFYDLMGKEIVQEMRRVIKSKNVLARNADSTIKKKGFNWPLVETKSMLGSIGYLVE